MTDVGEALVLHSPVFLNSADEATNPSVIALVITLPDGTTVTKAIGDLTDETGAGRYSYVHVAATAGVYSARWEASGNGVPTTIETFRYYVGTSGASGPCTPWVDAEDVFACRPSADIADESRNWPLAAKIARAVSGLLYNLSEGRYTGICRDVVRPCRSCAHWSQPDWFGGSWQHSWGTCGCGAHDWRHCGCTSIHEITLGASPILGVESVLIDGVALSSSAYRVDDRGWLVRIDGDPWPACQNLTLAATETDTFQVTFFYGSVPDDAAIFAAQRLAAEWYMACAGGECKLPARVRSLVRRGVEYGFVDPTELDNGRTGIDSVDEWLSALRWEHAHREPLIVNPDVVAAIRRTG